MKHLFKHIYIIGVIFAIIATTAACSVKYAFNGASIDYTKTKTIELAEFPIRSSYVWGPMGPMFNNQLKDEFASHTRLIQVKRNGDLKIEGEITQYSQRNKSVSSECQCEIHQQQEPCRGLRAPVYLYQELRHNAESERRTGRTRHTDGERPGGTDLQCYRGQLVNE